MLLMMMMILMIMMMMMMMMMLMITMMIEMMMMILQGGSAIERWFGCSRHRCFPAEALWQGEGWGSCQLASGDDDDEWMNGWMRQKVSLISLKLGTLKVQDRLIFAIFVFSDFAQKMWKKIRFKFEYRENFYKGFPCRKKISKRFLCKLNPYQN